MTRSIVLMLLCVLAATGAAPTPLSITREEQHDVMITIYNGNLGLVKDVRETRLPVATGEVQFMDVAALIDPPPSTSNRSLTRAGSPSSSRTTSTTELRNSKDSHLGLPLPKGKVRVYKADRSGSQQFIGEDWIDHTPKDERVKIKMGNAFDVVGERTQKDWRKLGSNLFEVEWEISLRNHKTEDQTVTVIEPVPGDWQVLASTHRYEKIESHTLKYEIPVPKAATANLTYRVRIRL
jgi:hypothetical protein